MSTDVAPQPQQCKILKRHDPEVPSRTASFPCLPSISFLLPRAKAQINEIGKKWRP